jgi:hypothetical protein
LREIRVLNCNISFYYHPVSNQNACVVAVISDFNKKLTEKVDERSYT